MNCEIYINPPQQMWPQLQRRCERSDSDITATVDAIIQNVRERGDDAVREIMRLVDGFVPESLLLDTESRNRLADEVSPGVREAIIAAKRNIECFHRAQAAPQVDVEVMPGVRCVQRAVAIDTVGLYIPGGKAPLFSTVLMLAVPAKIAGCRRVILCTPSDRNGRIAPEIALAANICGVDALYTVGGAQAIAAMAYGTQSIPRVDKIFGPGNRYVTKAKQTLAMKQVAIDMPAGPSEVMVIADSTANPAFVAADFLSQAEHGDDSQAMLVCDSEQMAQQVVAQIESQAAMLSRETIVEKALANSRIIVFTGDNARELTLQFANSYAPEHLIISMRDPWDIAAGVTAAGSVFIGNYSPESAGDYASGTNHTLPTGGWATAFSGVNLDSFTRKITYQELTPEGLTALSDTIISMARAEGLDAHANAVTVRLSQK